MTPALRARLAKLHPGDAFDMPDVDFPIRIAGLKGTADAPIVLRGGRITIPTGKRGGSSALFLKGCEYLEVENLIAAGGWDAISLSECADIDLIGITASGSANDGVKVANSTCVRLLDSTVTGGKDQAVDFFHVMGGSIERNTLIGPGSCVVFCKAGTTGVLVTDNEMIGPNDGIHFGDPGALSKMPAGVTAWAVDCHARGNRIAVDGRPIVFINAEACTQEGNALATTRMVGKRPGPLVVTVTR